MATNEISKQNGLVPSLDHRAEIDGLRAIAVLSVIARIIFNEIFHTGSFNLSYFYERRARRILPMLFVVTLVTIPFGWSFLSGPALNEFARSLIASTLFASNFFFYFETTQYGADSALLKPFLHTWSLAVEEQFYLNPELNFFLPFSRFWELAVGVALAYFEISRKFRGDLTAPTPSWLLLTAPLLGLGMIVFGIMTFDEATPHPGAWGTECCTLLGFQK